jgi:hypothetical protein
MSREPTTVGGRAGFAVKSGSFAALLHLPPNDRIVPVMAHGHIIETRPLPLQLEAGPAVTEAAPNGALDRLGVGISLGCAVHCLAVGMLSVVPSLLPIAELAPWLERLEWPFLVSAAVVGTTSLFPSYRRHGEVRPLALFGAGMALLSASRVASGSAELALTVTGVLTIAAAHVLNLRAQHVCAH